MSGNNGGGTPNKGPAVKQSFQTYEGQARLLAALVASQPTLKIDYKAVAECLGGGTTMSAVEHRFRDIKRRAEAINVCLEAGKDPHSTIPDLLAITNKIKPEELQRVYGSSTPGGLSFQFQEIKKKGQRMKDAADNGEDPIAAFNGPDTPSARRTTAATPRTTGTARGRIRARGGATPATGSHRTASKRAQNETTTANDDVSEDVDYDELEQSPSPSDRKKRRRTTAPEATAGPSRASTLPTESEANTPVAVDDDADDLIMVKLERISDNAQANHGLSRRAAPNPVAAAPAFGTAAPAPITAASAPATAAPVPTPVAFQPASAAAAVTSQSASRTVHREVPQYTDPSHAFYGADQALAMVPRQRPNVMRSLFNFVDSPSTDALSGVRNPDATLPSMTAPWGSGLSSGTHNSFRSSSFRSSSFGDGYNTSGYGSGDGHGGYGDQGGDEADGGEI